MNAWEWITVVTLGALGVSLIAWGLWLLVSDYLYTRRERRAVRASCRACQGTPVTLLTGDAARSRIYFRDRRDGWTTGVWIANPIGLCDQHHEQRQRIDRLERDTLDDRSDR